MNKKELLKFNFNELNEEARKIFETSDQSALYDFFEKCKNVAEVNEEAKKIYKLYFE